MATKLCKKKKRRWVEAIKQQIECERRYNNSKALYIYLKRGKRNQLWLILIKKTYFEKLCENKEDIEDNMNIKNKKFNVVTNTIKKIIKKCSKTIKEWESSKF